MEFTYEIDIQKALIVARENIIYGYSIRKKKANKVFSLLALLCLVGIVFSIIPVFRIFFLISNLFWLILSILMVFKGEEMQIKALQSQTKKQYKNKEKLKHSILIDSDQIAYIRKDNSKMSFSLNSIKRLIYRSDLDGLFFSKSKIARFVFFIDFSDLDHDSKSKIFDILLDNITDTVVKEELSESIPKY